MMLSDVCLSVAYIGPTSRIEAYEDQNWRRGSPRHTWLGHHFQGQKVKVARPLYSPPYCWRVRRLQRWAWERVGREKLLYVAVCSAARGASAPTGRGEGRGISWRPPAYSLLNVFLFFFFSFIFHFLFTVYLVYEFIINKYIYIYINVHGQTKRRVNTEINQYGLSLFFFSNKSINQSIYFTSCHREP